MLFSFQYVQHSAALDSELRFSRFPEPVMLKASQSPICAKRARKCETPEAKGVQSWM